MTRYRSYSRAGWLAALWSVCLAVQIPRTAGAEANAGSKSPALADRLASGGFGFNKLVLVQRHPIDCSHPYTYSYLGYRQGGGLHVYDLKSGDLKQLVDSTDGEIVGADLDYEGRKIVFAWRRGQGQPGKTWTTTRVPNLHLYTINTDGSGLRQLTKGEHHNFDPCWLPDGGIAFISTRVNQWVYCNDGPVGVLHRMDSDGANVVRLSANVLNDFTPSVMSDGQILFTRWEYVDKSPLAIQSLWSIRPDGTGLSVVYGNRVMSPSTFIEAQEIPRTQKLLCTMTGHVKPIRGAIGVIEPQKGVNAQAALRNLTPEIDVRPVDFGDGDLFRGPYESPFPLDDEHYLVSKDGDLLLRDYGGRQEVVVLKGRGGMGFYHPRPLRTRARPPVLSSQLPARSEAGPWATVYMQDVYNGLEPQVKRGEVKRICVVEEMPRDVHSKRRRCRFGVMNISVSCGATYAARTVWGFADVAEDGSAYFKIPAEKPVFFLPLDAEGRAVQRMRTYTHLMPGEVQGCIGCHATRNEQTPQRSLGFSLAVQRPAPQELRPPEWGERVGFDYEAIVQPVLNTHCIECHRGPDAGGGVRLTGERTQFFSTSYDTLAMGTKKAPDHRHVGQNGLIDNPYTNWISGFHGVEENILQIEPKYWGSPRSKLADLVIAGHPDGDGKPRVSLTPDEKQRIFTWIDLNVPFYGSFAAAAEDMDKTFDLAQPKK